MFAKSPVWASILLAPLSLTKSGDCLHSITVTLQYFGCMRMTRPKAVCCDNTWFQ